MTIVFGNQWSKSPIHADGADSIRGSNDKNIPSGRAGGNFAVRAVAAASITLALSISPVAMTWAQTATADSPKLQGTYAFTGTSACLSTAAPGPGFNPNLTPTDGSFGQSFTTEGIRTFNGDGTGT